MGNRNVATKSTGAKPVIGRPSKFSQELANGICERLANGDSLRKICAGNDMPDSRTVHRWIADNQGFCQQYAHAREGQAEFYADEIIEISDTATSEDVAVARLRVDARKWYAAKLAPKKYGDKITTEHTGAVGIVTSPMSALFDDEQSI